MHIKRYLLIGLLVCFVIGSSGCVFRDLYYLVKPEGLPSDEQIAEAYNQTELRKSTAADVLPLMYKDERQGGGLLSQSTKTLACYGQKKKGYKQWFTMVSFNENDLMAERKYLMIADEKPKIPFTEPWEGLRFDCQMVLTDEVLNQPYLDENARRVAIMQFVRDMTAADIDEVKTDNKAFEVCGAMINQALETVLVDLRQSPAIAAKLSDKSGLVFAHVSFGRGKIRMTDDGKIVTVRMYLGSFTKKWDKWDEKPAPAEQSTPQSESPAESSD